MYQHLRLIVQCKEKAHYLQDNGRFPCFSINPNRERTNHRAIIRYL